MHNVSMATVCIDDSEMAQSDGDGRDRFHLMTFDLGGCFH